MKVDFMATLKPTVRDLRRANRSTVLRALFFDGASNRLDISQRTGLSSATVTNIVAELLADGSIIEAGSEEPQVGRPRTILTPHAAHGYFAGVDVGEHQIRMELFDLTLHQVGDTQVQASDGLRKPQMVVEHIAAGIERLLTAAHVRPEQVLGVGIGVPGMVGHSTALSVFAPSIGWQNVPFQSMLMQRLPYPLFLDNGVKALAQAEALVGAGRGIQHFAAVLVGTGVGAGIITQGALYRGATNSAGEWGHTKIVLDGRPCRCGSSGCLEAYVGAPALLTRWRELDAGAVFSSVSEEEAVSALVMKASVGDAPAVQVLQETTRYLGLGIANLINLINPQRIMLGGWVGLRIGPLIMAELRRVVGQYALQSPFHAVTVDLCQLGQDAVALGAATLPLENFLASGGKGTLPRMSAGTLA
jgi:predicted NBD/HSP70 family sugar kinase